jgi:hypothetical protein
MARLSPSQLLPGTSCKCCATCTCCTCCDYYETSTQHATQACSSAAAAYGAGLLEALQALQLQEAHDGEQDTQLSSGGDVVVLGTGLVPLGQTHGIGEQDAGNGSHSPAAVGLLSLLVPGNRAQSV